MQSPSLASPSLSLCHCVFHDSAMRDKFLAPLGFLVVLESCSSTPRPWSLLISRSCWKCIYRIPVTWAGSGTAIKGGNQVAAWPALLGRVQR